MAGGPVGPEARTCPDPAEIAALVEGTLPVEAGARVRAHLACCPGCQRSATAYFPATAATRSTGPELGPRPQPSHPPRGGGEVEAPFPAIGRFEIRRPLGRGGMGVVYEAFDRERGAIVALKALRARNAASLLLFKNEFRAVQHLQHANLIELGELLEHEREWYFTMELVDGVDLLTYCRPGGSLDVGRVRSGFRQLVDGVSALHAHRMIHRDLKPSNVLVTAAGRVVVLDFGLVADTDEEILATQSGTYAFMAPEQVEGGELTAATDWYAVGVALYQVLTGDLPFAGAGALSAEARTRRDGPRPGARAPGAPEDLDELCVRLLRREAAMRPSGRELRAHFGLALDLLEVGEAPLYGRDTELALLRHAFDDSARAATVLTVRGASGLGKSTLARSFAREVARDPRAVVLSSRCHERETVRYKAIDGIVDALARWLSTRPPAEVAPLLPADMGLLAEVFPVLAPWAPDGPSRPTVIDPTERRLRVFAAVRALLTGLAHTRRVLLLIDDMQWADQDSLELLRAILRQPAAPSLLVLLLSRSGDGDPLVAPGLDLRSLELGPLTSTDAAALAARLWSDASGAALGSATEELAREAAGHPLFIATLVRQALRRDTTAPGLKLDDALHAEVERAGGGARRLLHLLAVAGTPLTLETARRALGVSLDTLARTSAGLRANKLIGAAGTRAEDPLEIYHDRIRETILDHLPQVEQRELHLTLAQTFGADADAEVLAHHWLGAARPDRAREHLVRAAERAAAALAFVQAARLYERALPLHEDHPDLQTELEAQRGIALANAGHAVEAAAALLRAAARLPRDAALDLERRAGEQLLMSGHIDEGMAVYRNLLQGVGIRLPGTPARAMVALLARRAQLRVRGIGYRPRAEAALARDERLRVDAIWAVGAGLSGVDMIRGAYAQTSGLLLALRAGEPYRITRALSLEAALVATAGPRARRRATGLLEEVDRIAKETEVPHAHGLAHGGRGVVAWFMGDFADAVGSCDRAVTIFRDQCTGVAWELDTAHLFGLLALYRLGRLADIRERTARLLAEADQRRDRYATVNLKTIFMALLAFADDRPDDAEAAVDEALAGWSQAGYHVQHYNGFVARLRGELYRGEGHAALARVLAEWPRIRRSLLPAMHQLRVESRWMRASAHVAAALEERAPRARSRLLARAQRQARVLAREPSWSAACLAELVRAGALAAAGDATAAVEAYLTALAAAEHGQMQHVSAAASHRLGELLGGDEGARLREQATGALRAVGVVAPERYVAMWAPG